VLNDKVEHAFCAGMIGENWATSGPSPNTHSRVNKQHDAAERA